MFLLCPFLPLSGCLVRAWPDCWVLIANALKLQHNAIAAPYTRLSGNPQAVFYGLSCPLKLAPIHSPSI
jgi:hypothetical protein